MRHFHNMLLDAVSDCADIRHYIGDPRFPIDEEAVEKIDQLFLNCQWKMKMLEETIELPTSTSTLQHPLPPPLTPENLEDLAPDTPPENKGEVYILTSEGEERIFLVPPGTDVYSLLNPGDKLLMTVPPLSSRSIPPLPPEEK
jgi:hypothetical protein